MLIKQGIGSTWGPPPKVQLWMYTGIVRPALTYGAVVWARRASTAFMHRQLKTVQRLGLTMLAPMRPSTPTSGLEMVAGLPPLDLHIRELAINSYNRLDLRPSGWTGRGPRGQIGHIVWLESQMDGLPPREFQDRCAINVSVHKFTTVIDDGIDDVTLPGVRLYTDGSSSSKTGAAFVAYQGNSQDPVWQGLAYLGDATVFQAEVHAIEGAAEYAANNNFNDVTIFSDSQSGLRAISSHVVRSRTVIRAIKALNYLGSNATVTLKWIKGHAGYTGNELADMLAKQASEQVHEGPGPILPLPASAVKAATRQQTIEKWISRWDGMNECRQTKIFFPSPNIKLSKELLNQNRSDLGLCIRHLTGHSFFRYHKSKVNPVVDPTCRLCGDSREESSHIILHCPHFQEQRFQIFFEYQPTAIHTVWQLHLFLTQPDLADLERNSSSDEDDY